MKTKIGRILSFLGLVFGFMLLYIIPTQIIPVSQSLLNRINHEEMNTFFPLLIIFSIYTTCAYWLLIRNTNQNGFPLFIKLAFANFMLYPLMGLLESVFWLNSLHIVDSNEFIKIFLRFLITYTLYSLLLSLCKKKGYFNEIGNQLKNLFKGIMWFKIAIISVIYFIIYNIFGYYVAWQFEATRLFYTGSKEIDTFFNMFTSNVSDFSFVLFHIARGIIFGISGYILYNIIDASKIRKSAILTLIFGGFGFQIILPNPIFPEIVRISHFIETTSSMLLFGFIISVMFFTMNGENVKNNCK